MPRLWRRLGPCTLGRVVVLLMEDAMTQLLGNVTPLWLAIVLVVIALTVIVHAIRTIPPRRCLHWCGGLGCKNMTTNFSGYCDDCLNDWGPGV